MKKIILIAYVMFLSISLIQAQESKSSKKENLHIELKDGVKPDIYVDGKKFDFPMDLLDINKIESINVLKGDKALKEYNTKNGVIIIVTKKNRVEIDKSKIKVTGYATKEGKAPMVIIDGKKSNQEVLKKLTPDDIKSIEVLKNEQAIKKYNASSGIIIVTTKKGEKK